MLIYWAQDSVEGKVYVGLIIKREVSQKGLRELSA